MPSSLPSLDDARRLIAARVRPLPEEMVPVEEALGRTTARSALAAESLPGFDNSAMDGFAVRAADTASGPVRLRVAGESRAGRPAPAPLSPGEAFRISTGAMLPAGADAVVRGEAADERGDGVVSVPGPVPAGHDVRRRGEEVAAGDALIEAGVVLRAADVGALAAAGVAEVACARRARVAVVVTGDELAARGRPLPAGAIRDSNRAMIAALALERGAEIVGSAAVGDDRDTIAAAVAGALGAGPDLLVSCGGMSVGPHDHVRGALEAAGVELLLAGVALVPGRPAAFGLSQDGVAVLGLPGNPLSAFVAFRLLGEPALGLPPRSAMRAVARPIARRPAVTRAVPVRLESGRVAPTGASGHGPTAALGADGLALVPPGKGELPAGALVEVAVL
jgi:molybdopterin molybdotransferase